jgi:hypothetical protein
MCGPECSQRARRELLLWEKRGSAVGARVGADVGVLAGGHEDRDRCALGLGDETGGGDTIKFGHVNVQEDEIRRVFGDEFDRLLTRTRLARASCAYGRRSATSRVLV